MKRRFIILFLLAVLFQSCVKEDEKSDQNSDSEIILTDDLGRQVILSKKPDRIISIAPSITENLFAIGAGGKLIGVTNYCDYPPEAKEIQKIGDINPDYELITALEPDLIFIVSSVPSSPILTKLESLGQKVFVADPKNLNDIFKQLEFLGELTGRTDEARQLVTNLIREKELIESEAIAEENECLIVLSLSPLVTVNKNTFFSQAVTLTGLINIFADESIEYPTVSYESAISKDPDVIVLPVKDDDPRKEEKLNTMKEKFSTTKAVKRSRIIVVDPDILLRSTVRLLEGSQQIEARLKSFR